MKIVKFENGQYAICIRDDEYLAIHDPHYSRHQEGLLFDDCLGTLEECRAAIVIWKREPRVSNVLDGSIHTMKIIETIDV